MLIAIDGIYSAGKSTVIRSLLERLGGAVERPIAVSEWNSSDLLGEFIPAWKRDTRLGAYSLLLVEAADLAHRCERSIWSHLAEGGLVLADRYVLSGIARSVIRGADPSVAASAFEFAPRETLTVLVECPPELTLERRKRLGKRLGGYHSGRDYRRTADLDTDFVTYQAEMAALYRTLAADRGPVVAVDARRPVAESVDEVMAEFARTGAPA